MHDGFCPQCTHRWMEVHWVSLEIHYRHAVNIQHMLLLFVALGSFIIYKYCWIQKKKNIYGFASFVTVSQWVKKPHSIVYDNELLTLQPTETRFTYKRAMNQEFVFVEKKMIYLTICATAETVLYKEHFFKHYLLFLYLLFIFLEVTLD